MQKKAGFSLLELMIVIGIIAILSAIVTPNVIRWFQNQGLRSAVSELQGNLQLAKLTAVRQNESCTVNFNTVTGSYDIPCANKTVLLSSYSGGVVFGMPPASGGTMATAITFTSGGQCSLSRNVFLTDRNNSAYYKILTLVSGGIVTSKWNGSDWQ